LQQRPDWIHIGRGPTGVQKMFSRKLFLLAVLALALPIAAFANSSVDFGNVGGTLSGTSSGLSLSGSTLTSVNGLNGGGLITGNLGTVIFSTGALVSGSLDMGGTFAGGGSFTITGNGTTGIQNGGEFLRLIQRSRHLEPGHSSGRNPQLHLDWGGHRIIARCDDKRCDSACD